MSKQTVLIGADPEVFVGRNGQVLSAIGLIGGSKSEPLRVDAGALQEDNVLLEYNIDPAASLAEFSYRIKHVLSQGVDSLSRFQLEVQASLSSHIYDDETFSALPDAAFVFGCEPDYNAWSCMENVFPQDVNPKLRTAGGHIHIGYSHLEKVTMEKSEDIIRMCDIVLGIPSVLMDRDDRRKQLYGKGGAMRYKKYGPEYRSLSNFWIFSDELIAWAYAQAVRAYEDKGNLQAYCDALGGGDEIQRIINTNDKAAAARAVGILGLEVA